MKKQLLTTILTVLITVAVIITLVVVLMPTLGPRFLHPLMADTMHENMPAGMHEQMMNSVPPDNLDTSTTRTSDNGFYQVSFSSELEPLAINQMHSWILHVETADGEPVEDAVITVDGGMPQHGHGLPTQPQVTENLGGGDYRVEGLRFQMGGWWEVSFAIDAAATPDSVTFNLVLEG
ncbi:MAG: FixH family protein [Candidatus Promineifilaceae bacterium]